MQNDLSKRKIHIHDPKMDVDAVIRNITKSYCQEDAEAFYVCDIDDIILKHHCWKKTMPRVEPFYAIKCNDDETVLRAVAKLGTGFDCASMQEVHKVLSLGMDPDRIIFANPTKPIGHVKYAASRGVTLMTFDGEHELYKIKKFHPQAKLVIRIRYDDPSATYIFGEKFGCDHKTEAKNLLEIAQSLKLNVVGVSFHIGSCSQDYHIFSSAIAAAREVFDLGEECNFTFDLLDIGGGFPGTKGTSIGEIGDNINEALEMYFPDPSIRVIAEPGRYYVSSAFTLANPIHSVRMKYLLDNNGERSKLPMYYTNAGLYSALPSLLFGESYEATSLNSKPKDKLYPSIIWGPTGDGFDKVSENALLPEMSIGEWIIFQDTGAYTVVVACEFNGFPKPRIHTVIDHARLLDDFPLLKLIDNDEVTDNDKSVDSQEE